MRGSSRNCEPSEPAVLPSVIKRVQRLVISDKDVTPDGAHTPGAVDGALNREQVPQPGTPTPGAWAMEYRGGAVVLCQVPVAPSAARRQGVAAALHELLLGVPTLRVALASLDEIRLLPHVARDIASLSVALCLRVECTAATVLWQELARCRWPELFKDSLSDDDDTSIDNWAEHIHTAIAHDPLEQTQILHSQAAADYALTEDELAAMPASLQSCSYWCPEAMAHLTVQVRQYRKAQVTLKAYRKWGSAWALDEARQRLAAMAARKREARREELQDRLGAAELAPYAATELCREYVETGMVPVENVVVELGRAHQSVLRRRMLHNRLEEEGLQEYAQEEVCKRHLRELDGWSLEAVVGAIRAHQRRIALWQRLLAAGMPPSCIHEPCCRQHIKTGAFALEDVLHQLGAFSTEQPRWLRAAGGPRLLYVTCTRGGCQRSAAAGCITRCCTAHCDALLCKGH